MIWIADAHRDDGKRFVAVASANRSTACCNARMAARRRSHRSVPLIECNRALELRGTRACLQARVSQKAYRKGPRCLTQRASFASPHAERDVLSGVTGDRELNAFISGPAAFVGGVPLTRARSPWAIPEAST
jgi:hypothetical protein